MCVHFLSAKRDAPECIEVYTHMLSSRFVAWYSWNCTASTTNPCASSPLEVKGHEFVRLWLRCDLIGMRLMRVTVGLMMWVHEIKSCSWGIDFLKSMKKSDQSRGFGDGKNCKLRWMKISSMVHVQTRTPSGAIRGFLKPPNGARFTFSIRLHVVASLASAIDWHFCCRTCRFYFMFLWYRNGVLLITCH